MNLKQYCRYWKQVIVCLALGFLLLGVGVVISYASRKPLSVNKSQQITSNTDLLQGQWSYMPGVVKTTNGLTVKPTDLAIVKQDGTFAQSNPPINLAGTHLQNVTGDFAINAVIRPLASSATIQLYGEVPIIADEFRVERKSISLTIQKGTLTVRVWNGSGQNPVKEKSFTFVAQETNNLTITRHANQLLFTINNKDIGSVSEQGVFKSGTVWFGLDAKDSNWQLVQLNAQKLTGNLTVADASIALVTHHDPQGLQAVASQKRPGFVVGAAMALGPMVSDQQYAQVVLDKNMFGGMTTENQMKMINLQPQRGVYTFEQADAMVAIAKQNGLSVHGHALVFGEANPLWFSSLPVTTAADKQVIEQIMTDHITNVVSHFKGRVTSWDVINEPLADYDDTPDGEGAAMRQHKWYQAMQDSYIIKGLVAAHNADSNAALFINEYGLEADGARWDYFVALMGKLKSQLTAQGVPIEKVGVGFQAHVYTPTDRIDPQTLRSHIQQMGQLGFKVQISENDVYGDYNGRDRTTDQTQQYAAIFTTCLQEKNCVAYRAWIPSDRYDYFIDDDGSIQTGIDGLFDSAMQPRPAVKQMLSL